MFEEVKNSVEDAIDITDMFEFGVNLLRFEQVARIASFWRTKISPSAPRLISLPVR